MIFHDFNTEIGPEVPAEAVAEKVATKSEEPKVRVAGLKVTLGLVGVTVKDVEGREEMYAVSNEDAAPTTKEGYTEGTLMVPIQR